MIAALPDPWRARAFILVALAGIALGPACDRAAVQSDEQTRMLEEQKAINAYSAKVATVDEAQKRFADAWKKANEIKSFEQFRDAIEGQVIPALQSYVTALNAMPAQSKALTAIHGIVVQEYERGVEAFKVFIDGLEDEIVEERYQVLLKAMDAIADAEKRYRGQLEEYYSKNRVKLVATAAAAP